MRRKPFKKCVSKEMQKGLTKKEAKKVCREEINQNK